jgi:endonuclease G
MDVPYTEDITMISKTFTFTAILLMASHASAHSGNTNSSGCHKQKSTGGYHCHNTKTPTKTTTTKTDIKMVSDLPDNRPTKTVTIKAAIAMVSDLPDNRQAVNNPILTKFGDDTIKVEYQGFKIWLDCSKRSTYKFQYIAQRDTGNYPRVGSYSLDNSIPIRCQQNSTTPYGNGYERGHLVPANHMDYSKTAIAESNYMTNILPQTVNMNRGAWLATEEIVEYYRDISDVQVIGGVLYGEDSRVLPLHDIPTPSAYWKVVIRDDDAIAWIIPNTKLATRKNLDLYLVSVNEIERRTGEVISIPNYDKDSIPSSSWHTPNTKYWLD